MLCTFEQKNQNWFTEQVFVTVNQTTKMKGKDFKFVIEEEEVELMNN
jgi:hypothetical protein